MAEADRDDRPAGAGPDGSAAAAAAAKAYEPPKGSERHDTWRGPDGAEIGYTARAGWTLLRDEKDEPVAEIFSVSYTADHAGADRPVTFVFNGGPGASSVYLHLGAVGPRRVRFDERGRPLPSPTRLVDNAESWLAFTDLVFIDPVGTGFSRVVEHGRPRPPTEEKEGEGKKPDPKAFFAVQRDLDALAEFITRWLSNNDRWGSPVLVSGESYGGFRTAKLARLLPETYGVGLVGAVIISPALEFALLDPSDYDLLPFVDLLPTMAAGAAVHGRCRAMPEDASLDEVLAAAETFATGPFAATLLRGAAAPPEQREEVLARAAAFIGLPEQVVRVAEGRVTMYRYVRELLRDRGEVVSLYDASLAVRDPFPDRDSFAGAEPGLGGSARVFASGINQRLRTELGVETDRPYETLSVEVFTSWKVDLEKHALDRPVGAVDDLRYGMALDPHLQVFLTHGRYDLVTPYFASDRLRNLMRLDPATADRITVQHFPGGHMFYAWEESRIAFRDAVASFYARAVGAAPEASP